MPIVGNRQSMTGGGTGTRGIKFNPNSYFSYNDTGINTNEALDNAETGIDCDADATTAIPAGSIIKIDTEFMFVTATGTTLTVVRPNPVAHNTNADIYKKVNNCVLWLPGQDDPYSTTIRDRSGNNNNGTIAGATWVRLPSGLWVNSFDGVDDSISFPSTGLYDFAANSSFSIVAWVNPIDVASRYIVCMGVLGTAINYALRFAGDGLIKYANNAVEVNGFNYEGVLNKWSLFSLVVTTNTDVDFYLNTVNTDAVGNGNSGPVAGNLYIGQSGAGSGYMYGKLELTRIYSRALTATDIAGIYQQERHLLGV